AHVTSRIFLPRKSESEWRLPAMSGRVKLGARSEVSVSTWSERRPKYQVEVAVSRATGWCTSSAHAFRLNHSFPDCLRRKSACRAFGNGKQSSSRQTP